MADASSRILVQVKDQATQEFNKIFSEVRGELDKNTSAAKALQVTYDRLAASMKAQASEAKNSVSFNGTEVAALEDQAKQAMASSKAMEGLKDTNEQAGKGFMGLGINVVDVAAKLYLVQTAVRAVIEAMQQGFEFGKLGAEVIQTEKSFASMTLSVGSNKEMLDKLREAARGTASDLELMQAAQTALIGLSRENGKAMADALPHILEIARAASIANPKLGDTAFLFESLTTGLKRLSPRLIDNTGLQLKLGEAEDAYAATVGKTSKELSGEEKQLALLNATMEAGDRLIQQVGSSTGSAVDPFDRLAASSKNLFNTIAEKSAPALTLMVNGLNNVVTGIQALLNRDENFANAIMDHNKTMIHTADTYAEYRSEMERALGTLGLTIDSTGKIVSETGQYADVAKRLNAQMSISTEQTFGNAKAMDALALRSEGMNKVTERGIELSQDAIDAHDKFIEKRDKSMQSLFMKELDINQRRVDSERKTTDKITSEEQKTADKINKIHLNAEQDRTRVAQDFADKRADIERTFAEKSASADKDIAALKDELANKNPFISESTQASLKSAQDRVDEFQKHIKDMQRAQRLSPEDFDRQIVDYQNQIETARDHIASLTNTTADLKREQDANPTDERAAQIDLYNHQITEARATLESLTDSTRTLQQTQKLQGDEAQRAMEEYRAQLENAQSDLDDIKNTSREEERQNRIKAQIQEKEELKHHLEEKKNLEIADLEETQRKKIDAITATEKEITAATQDESDKRLETYHEEFTKIGEDAERNLKDAILGALEGLAPAGSEAAKAIFELQAKNHGATSAMVEDFMNVKNAIQGEDGLQGAVQRFQDLAFHTFGTVRGVTGDINSNLTGSLSLVNQLNDSGAFTESRGNVSGRRAGGGGVNPGESYLVGENGPEVLTMGGGGGNITPNGGGGISLTIPISAGVFMGSAADARKFGDMVGPIVMRYLDQYGSNRFAIGSRKQ